MRAWRTVLTLQAVLQCGCFASHTWADDGDAGSRDASARDAGRPLSLDEFLVSWRAAWCEREVHCEGRFLNPGFQALSCHPRSPFIERPWWLSGDDVRGAVARGSVRYDARWARACIAATRDASICTLRTPDACSGVLAGTTEIGAPCLGDTDCTGDAYCDDWSSCPGLCEPRGGNGADCAAVPCAPGFACIESRCRSQATLGGSCAGTICAPDFNCDASRVCVPLSAEGDPCTTHGDCAARLLCIDSICQTGVGVGSPCSVAAPCATGTRCVEGSCVRVGLPGETCGPTSVCPGSFHCSAGVCTPDPVVGEACESSATCAQGVCSDGTCAFASRGATCTPTIEPTALPFDECEGYCDWFLERCVDAVSEGEACGSIECARGLRCGPPGAPATGTATCRPDCF